MKFMKLGSRPDTFYDSEAESVRCVSSEVSSDLIILVNGTKYMLHKFPLLSKCARLQKLCSESLESHSVTVVQLPDFPGGADAFELCAKFCYGITITLSAYNIISARCAAEYLQMTEDVEKGNLIFKLEVFCNSCILHGWRDSIVTLQTTKSFSVWSEKIGLTTRCIEAIASKILSHPFKENLSRSYSHRRRDDISFNGAENRPTENGWWAEDIAELSIDLYWRTMIVIKSGGRVPSNLIGDALKIHASTWLPNISKYGRGVKGSDSDGEKILKYRLGLESIMSLLPVEKDSVSCSFLCSLLKAANILNASSLLRMELARRIGTQLEEATVNDLLIPSGKDGLYDVDIVMMILEQFMLQGQSPPTSPPRTRGGFERRRSRSAENIDFEFQESRRSSSASHSSKIKVSKLVDQYLQEIAVQEKLTVTKVIALAEAVPDFTRLDHDDLYRAINIYLKAHPDLNKSERKKLCRVLDCKKLSMEACMHAAQNEKLPLRVVVQVLFSEQARANMSGGRVTKLPDNIKVLLAAHGHDTSRPSQQLSTSTYNPAEEQWSISGFKSPNSKLSTLKMHLAEDDNACDNDSQTDEIEGSSRLAFCVLPARPKRMLSKLWSVNRTPSEKN